MSILRLDNIVKTYQDHVAVDHVSFEIPEGCIFGLLGPNGAGKTSLIRIITTITRADSGTVYINGESLSTYHPSMIGYMPEERGLYKKMKVGEHLLYLAQLKGLSLAQAKSACDHWFSKFDITDWWDKKVEELSKGMQQKIQFIATVIHDPALLILDEPFSGLDPINTNLIKDEIYQLKQKGKSIIFSTHRMEQVEEICELIVLINQGKNVLEGAVKDIKNEFKKHEFHISYEGTIPEQLISQEELIDHQAGKIILSLADEQAANARLKKFMEADVLIHEFHEILPSLNEIFIQQVNSDQNSSN